MWQPLHTSRFLFRWRGHKSQSRKSWLLLRSLLLWDISQCGENSVPTFRDNPHIQPETSAQYYFCMLCQIPEKCRSHVHRGGSLKFCMFVIVIIINIIITNSSRSGIFFLLRLHLTDASISLCILYFHNDPNARKNWWR